MSTPSPSVRKSRKTIKKSLERIRTIAEASNHDKHLSEKEKADVSEWVTEQSSAALIPKESFTGMKGLANRITPNKLLSDERRLELERDKAETEALKVAVSDYQEAFLTLSQRAKQRAEQESRRNGAFDSAPAEASPSSNNLPNITIHKKLYNVTVDDEFTYNSVPSLTDIDKGQPPENVPGPSLDLRSAKGSNPADSSVSTSGHVQMDVQSSQEAQVGIGRVAESGGRITGRDSPQYHGHHTNPSMSSSKSDPSRAPSSASIRPSLPVPPYRLRRRRDIETKLKTSSSQPLSERSGVEPVSTEQFQGNTNGAAQPQRHYGNTESITMPRDNIGTGHQRSFSNYWSDESTEEEHSYENFD